MEKKYKVVFFADKVLEHTQAIRENLSREFSCFTSSQTDEYRQVFLQSGKFVLLFSDAKKAIIFRQTPDNSLFSLEYEILVYLHTDSAFKADSQKLLDQNNIKVFRKSEVAAMIQYLHAYLSESETTPEDELEFYMPPDSPPETPPET